MSAARNVYIGQEIERTEDFRFLTGTRHFRRRLRAGRPAARSDPAQHGAAWADHEQRCSAALKMPGVHAVITRAISARRFPRIPIRLAPIAGLEKYLQPVIADEKVRYVGEPLAVIVADSRAIAEDAAAKIDVTIEPLAPAGWRAAEADAACCSRRTAAMSRLDIRSASANERGLRRRRLYAARVLSRPSPHRVPMETRGVVAEWDAGRGTTYRQRRDQGDVLQPSRARRDDADVGKRDRPDGARRWRRIRRARRILPGRFLDPVRRAQTRPAGEMDRGPARAYAGGQPLAGNRLRTRDRLPARRHYLAYAERSTATWAPIRAPIPAWCRRKLRNFCTGPIAFPRSRSRSRPT